MSADGWKRTKRVCAVAMRKCARGVVVGLLGFSWSIRKTGKGLNSAGLRIEDWSLDELQRVPPSWRSYALLAVVVGSLAFGIGYCAVRAG